MKNAAALFALVLLCSGLTACGGGCGVSYCDPTSDVPCDTSTPNPGPPQPPPSPCGLPPGMTQIALVYPKTGSIDIPDNIGQLIVASNSGFPGYAAGAWGLVVLPVGTTPNAMDGAQYFPGTYTTQITTGPLTPPFTAPYAVPSFASPIYQAATFGTLAVGQLQSGVSYQVYVYEHDAGCMPSQLIGAFISA